MSRSMKRRIAIQKGEPTPEFAGGTDMTITEALEEIDKLQINIETLEDTICELREKIYILRKEISER